MKQIYKTVLKVVLGGKSTKHNVWKIVESSDPDLIGETTCCGVPRATDYPLGTKYTVTIRIPSGN